MIYKITIKKGAIKALESIPEPHYSNIKSAIYQLATHPRPPGCKKLKGREGYRIRVGNYRVVYNIFDRELIVDVVTLGHRKDVYD